ncbi:putative colanic acid biosynthesis acetyltransferase WcaF [Rhodoligotrophos appendicifer]|uniref:WcaF family extracellular polysaccharide biosynthesis acetyltransferase n=1 Tax=Rhodoligotrophos appendicifer TaxID=987056 RepID=UPI00117F76A1|nr:WcaF family extracellular polysaccharide biosynthesis acetyltransferase [Rhodoligotrophos appendicifer]
MTLEGYSTESFSRGRPWAIEVLWHIVQAVLIRSVLPGSAHRRVLLRLFGACIGRGVVIRPGVRVKFPWRLSVGDHSWIGEDVWIDNLAPVSIGSNCCISQGAYLCTGNHDWTRGTFNLITQPIALRDGSWIAARGVVGPGVVVEEGAVLSLGSVATSRLCSWQIHAGVPALPIGPRVVET